MDPKTHSCCPCVRVGYLTASVLSVFSYASCPDLALVHALNVAKVTDHIVTWELFENLVHAT